MSAAVPIYAGAAMLENQLIKDEAKAEVGALRKEAQLQAKNAELIREAGAFNANRQQLEAQRVFGGIKADIAASGITQESGSALEILRQSYSNAELDRLTILYESELDAIGALNRSQTLGAQAESIKKTTPLRQATTFVRYAGFAAGSKG